MLMGDAYSCWACSQQAESSDFEETLDELVERDRKKLDDYRSRVQKLESARDVESSPRELRDE